MGLAAGQARLLTITGRKSDCEFESMRLSHQKIALSRELTDVSNEYQDSLNQTKLVYDYYGTGDTSTQLSYGILMYPSALNNYMPTLITDPSGRAVLNSKYAAAARAAGIPQEGLGTLPSEEMRNAFIAGLASAGIITEKLAETITGLPYNQAAGFGGGATVAVTTEAGNYDSLAEYIKNSNGTAFVFSTCSSIKGINNKGNTSYWQWGICSSDLTTINKETERSVGSTLTTQITLSDLLDDSKGQIYLNMETPGGEQTPVIALALMQSKLGETGGFIDWLYDEFSAVLDLGDGYTSAALEYAYNKTLETYVNSDTEARDYWLNKIQEKNWDLSNFDSADFSLNDGNDTYVKNYADTIGKRVGGNEWHKPSLEDLINYSEKANYIGYTCTHSRQEGGHDDGKDYGRAAVNLNTVAKAFLTYFADYMNGVAKTDSYGIEVFDVNIGSVSESHLASENTTFEYTWKIGSEVSSDDLGQATFYDALFNQICANGWTENNEITQNEYLQQMLQSGMMFISTVKDDNYYYQGNYATDTYIKEISDETKIAYAEAKYNTEKAKLNAKEETIDLKMKNLDTEISSLTTEYDTVKNTISKQIEKSFKRFNA